MTKTLQTSPGQLSLPEFRELACRRLAGMPSPDAMPSANGPSDFDLNPGILAEENMRPLQRVAAVLVPVVARPQPTVLFTLRTGHLPAHAGQISFPGGKKDDSDASLIDTALREAMEEIGLPVSQVEVLGFLDPYQTGTGYLIAPAVGLVAPDFQAKLNFAEVAEVFEVPLSFLMDARNHRVHDRAINGRKRSFYAMPFGDRYIWGATAGILKNMHARLFCA